MKPQTLDEIRQLVMEWAQQTKVCVASYINSTNTALHLKGIPTAPDTTPLWVISTRNAQERIWNEQVTFADFNVALTEYGALENTREYLNDWCKNETLVAASKDSGVYRVRLVSVGFPRNACENPCFEVHKRMNGPWETFYSGHTLEDAILAFYEA